MNKNNKKANLKEFLDSLLKEQQQVPVQYPQSTQEFMPNTQPVVKPSSLDQAVDGYLVRYERESIPMSQVYESLNELKDDLLSEQTPPGEEEPPADDEAAPVDDAGGGDDMPDFGTDDSAPADDAGGGGAPAPGGNGAMPVVSTPRIDLNAFTQAVARLVGNYQSLIDPKTLILNRAEAFIKNNYDEKTAQEMMEILDVTYDLRPQEAGNTDTQDASQFPTSYTTGGLATG